MVVVAATARQLGATGAPSKDLGKLLVVRGLAVSDEPPRDFPRLLAAELLALAYVPVEACCSVVDGGASSAPKLPARYCRTAPPPELLPANTAAARFALRACCHVGMVLPLPSPLLLLLLPSTLNAAPGAGDALFEERSNRSVISRGKLRTRRSRFSRGGASLLP